MREILNYDRFLSLNESKDYKDLSGVDKSWNGEYILRVNDYQKNGTSAVKGDILVAKDSGKAIALTYLKSDGSEGKYLWVPNFGVFYTRNIKGGISSVKISPYKNWLSQPGTEEKITEFLDGFQEEIQKEKSEKEKTLSLQAQNDLDLILDMYGINSPISEFKKGNSETEWEAILENGFTIVISKRSPEDLVAEFRIYPDRSSESAFVTISNQRNNTGFSFKMPGKAYINRNIHMTKLNEDPVANYLFKKICGILEYEDEKSLLSYFESLLKSYDPDYSRSDDYRSYRRGSGVSEEINLVSDLLSDFLTDKKIEEIRLKNKKG